METSKVKEITKVTEYNGQNGLILYHQVILENGAKINIGKKTKMNVGEELTYELTGGADDQFEYKKAKAVKQDFKPGGKFEPKDQGVITWLSCFSSVCQNTQQSQMAGNMPTILKLTNEAFAEAMKHSTLKP